jgi:hypothetical protein
MPGSRHLQSQPNLSLHKISPSCKGWIVRGHVVHGTYYPGDAWSKEKSSETLYQCTLGYNEFDFFSENKEYRPFDGCKIEIEDTFTKYVF